MSSKDKAKKAIPHLMLALKTLATSESTLALSGDILLAALLKRKGVGKVRFSDTMEFVTTEKTGGIEKEKTNLLSLLEGLGFDTIASNNTITFIPKGDSDSTAHITLRDEIRFKNEGDEKLFSYHVRHLAIEEEMAYLVYLLSGTTARGWHVANYHLYLEMGYTLPSIKVKMFLDKHKLKLGDFHILNSPLALEDSYEGLETEDVIRAKVKEGLAKVIATAPLASVTKVTQQSSEPPTSSAATEEEKKDKVFQLNHKAVPEEGKPIPSHIRDRILELADIVQPWGQHGGKVVKFLAELKNRGDLQNIIYFRFWEEVSSAFFGKTIYREVELYRHYEGKFRKNTDPFFEIHRASRTDNGFYAWMRLNKRYFDFIQPTLDAVYDIKDSVGRDLTMERTVYTDEALRLRRLGRKSVTVFFAGGLGYSPTSCMCVRTHALLATLAKQVKLTLCMACRQHKTSTYDSLSGARSDFNIALSGKKLNINCAKYFFLSSSVMFSICSVRYSSSILIIALARLFL